METVEWDDYSKQHIIKTQFTTIKHRTKKPNTILRYATSIRKGQQHTSNFRTYTERVPRPQKTPQIR